MGTQSTSLRMGGSACRGGHEVVGRLAETRQSKMWLFFCWETLSDIVLRSLLESVAARGCALAAHRWPYGGLLRNRSSHPVACRDQFVILECSWGRRRQQSSPPLSLACRTFDQDKHRSRFCCEASRGGGVAATAGRSSHGRCSWTGCEARVA